MGPSSTADDREAATVNLFRNYELRTAFAQPERRRLPTTLVTGWLGSGKTTVMRHVLANRQDLRVACGERLRGAQHRRRARRARGERRETRGQGRHRHRRAHQRMLVLHPRRELETEVWQHAGRRGARDDEGVGSVDYLLIETSGLVDPTETVAALGIGKLARASASIVSSASSTRRVRGPRAEASSGRTRRVQTTPRTPAWARQLSGRRRPPQQDRPPWLEKKRKPLDARPDATRVAAARAFVLELGSRREVRRVRARESAPPDDPGRRARARSRRGVGSHDWDSAERPFLSPREAPCAKPPSRLPVRSSSTPPRVSIAPAPNVAAADANDFGPSPSRAARSLSPRSSAGPSGIPSSGVARARVRHVRGGTRHDVRFPPLGERRVEIGRAWVKTRARDDARRPLRRRRRARRRNPRPKTATAPATRLVLIGSGVDPEADPRSADRRDGDERRVEGTSTRAMTRDSTRAVIARRARLRRATSLLPRTRDWNWWSDGRVVSRRARPATCVHFRLTGARSNGITVREMERDHGVDFNRMNAELVRALNAGGKGATARRQRRGADGQRIPAAEATVRGRWMCRGGDAFEEGGGRRCARRAPLCCADT